MDNLAIRADRYKTRIDEINALLAQLDITYEENKQLREYLNMYKDLLRRTNLKIKTQEIKKNWGF